MTEAEIAAVLDTYRSGWLTMGPRVAELERRFAAHVGRSHAVAVCSHGAARELAALVAGFDVHRLLDDVAILAGEDADADRELRLLRSHAMTSGTWQRHRAYAASYDVVGFGFNYRLDEPRAALALARLDQRAR